MKSFLLLSFIYFANYSFACKDVGDQKVFIDERCSKPGTKDTNGCNAGGQGPNCRFCGFDQYPPCPNTDKDAPSKLKFTIVNNCKQNIWIGFQGKSEKEPNYKPNYSGNLIEVKPNAGSNFDVPGDLNSGRIWARTGCKNENGQFKCETGDCGSKECDWNDLEQDISPATVAEFTLNGWGNKDYYFISLQNGYNLKVKIQIKTPQPQISGNEKYWCQNIRCLNDLNYNCPQELKKVNNYQVIGCYSPCQKFKRDEYCCEGDFDDYDKCQPSKWNIINYPESFRKACPNSFNHPYDEKGNVYSCVNTGYFITFC